MKVKFRWWNGVNHDRDHIASIYAVAVIFDCKILLPHCRTKCMEGTCCRCNPPRRAADADFLALRLKFSEAAP